MTVALFLLLLIQADPRIESVERLVGNANRTYLWAPLAVTLRSDSGFEGDLVAQSSLGVRVVRKVRVAPGGGERFLLPAIDPRRVVAGGTTFEVPRGLKSPDLLVLVDARLPYAGQLVSDDRVLYVKIELADLGPLLAWGVLEACDLLLVKEAAGLSPGCVRSWAVAPARGDAEQAVGGLLRAGEPVRLVDPELWPLAPEGGWVPAKKERAVLFAVLYAFAGFVTLAFVGRTAARWAPVSVAAIATLGVVAFLLVFPRGHLWVSESACEVVPVQGDAGVIRLWFAGAAADLSPTIDFPRVVKPVFARLADAEEPLTIRVLERGSRAEGFQLAAGRRACFAAVEGRAPTMRLGRPTRPLYGASLRQGGVTKYLGDLERGAEILREPLGGTSPRDAEDRPWLRFLDGDGVYGRLERGDRAAGDVGSPDLADARCRPVFFIQRLK